MNNKFKEQCANLNENDPFYFLIKENLTQKYEDLEAIDMYMKRKNKRKTENNNYDFRI